MELFMGHGNPPCRVPPSLGSRLCGAAFLCFVEEGFGTDGPNIDENYGIRIGKLWKTMGNMEK
jgi:hypothetical protein